MLQKSIQWEPGWTDGQTVRLTDLMKLIVTYCNFVNVPKIPVPHSQKSLKLHYID